MKLGVFILAVLCTWSGQAIAFQMNPNLSDETINKGTEKFSQFKWRLTQPIHEELTKKTIINVLSKDGICKNVEKKEISSLAAAIIEGSEWNDDPSKYLPKKPIRWAVEMQDANNRAKGKGWWLNKKVIDSKYKPLYRSHYGDLQFLHAMASSTNIPAINTRHLIMMWIEFAYKVSNGEIKKKIKLRNAVSYLSTEKSRDLFSKLFLNTTHSKGGWQVQYMFSAAWNRSASEIRSLALGSILHIIQDSFSDSHVDRIPSYAEVPKNGVSLNGRNQIREFLAYNKQSSKKHAKSDVKPKDINDDNLDIIDYSSQVVLCAFSQQANSWETLRPYLMSKVFLLADHTNPSSAGKYAK
ncbi:MAG: hypothetical protein JKY53_12880 [Flavobacteriales bacterium]|nr:hypothetical protein [Flavobacteriales bacterium]